MLRKWRSRRGGYPNWSRLGAATARSATSTTANTKRVLVATSVGSQLSSTMLESTIAEALRLRGVEVDVLLCDHALPICVNCEHRLYATNRLQKQLIDKGPGALCDDCFKPARKMFSQLDVGILGYRDHLDDQDFAKARREAAQLRTEDIRSYRLGSIAVGEHAYAGALKFFARGDTKGEPHAEAILRRYLEASLLTVFALQRLLSRERYDSVFFNHGIYVPQGLVGEVCRQHGVRVINWHPAYRKQCFIFSHSDTYHHTLMNEPVSEWEDIPWNKTLANKIDAYLKSRWVGVNDWIWFHHKPSFDVQAISREVGIDFGKPCIGLLTNVIWDAQLHYPANAFRNMMEWLTDTIDYFKNRPDINLIVRIHPAELRGATPSRQVIADEIKRKFPKLPPNVFVVPPSSNASTYTLMSLCDSVLIYGTKTGVELTAAGIPVIVAGEAWMRGKGISMDVQTRDEYVSFLNRLPLGHRLDPSVVERAQKYAFHFFFRRMIPLDFMTPKSGWPPYVVDVNSVEDLAEGKSVALDIICDGILKNHPFVYPEERIHTG